MILVEELSAKALLDSLLPRLQLDARISIRIQVFRGKQDMDKRLVQQLQGYHNPAAAVRFLVVRDLDGHPDCQKLKRHLLDKCRAAGKEALVRVRIACTELETIYLADLAAVERALGVRGLDRQQNTAKFRAPDYLGSPSRELATLTGGAYQKVSGSRANRPAP